MDDDWQPAEPADRVWNRAALQGGGTTPEAGDRALADLLRFHGLAMNGGVLHALECLDHDEIDRAITGFEFFGLADVGDLLRSLPETIAAASTADDVMDELEHSTDARYIDDAAIEAAFLQRYTDQPGSFAPPCKPRPEQQP